MVAARRRRLLHPMVRLEFPPLAAAGTRGSLAGYSAAASQRAAGPRGRPRGAMRSGAALGGRRLGPRARAPEAPGLLATLGAGVLFGFAWFVVSVRLPAADGVPPSAFVPGAVVFGVGLEALHVLTVYFLANKLASASDLYGVLGLATTTLFYLYLVGRGIIWAAELNAVVWTVRRERESSPEDR